MKKMFLSPLCSALVIPGLGQIMNQQLKKGVLILLGVLVLFIMGVVKLSLLISATLSEVDLRTMDSFAILEKLRDQNFSVLWALLVAFGLLWLYSVVDAFRVGRERDRAGRGDRG